MSEPGSRDISGPMLIVAIVLAAGAAQAADAPSPPFTPQFREFVRDVPEAEIERLHGGIVRFCRGSTRFSTFGSCVVILDDRIVDIARQRRELARRHYDPDHLNASLIRNCEGMYRDAGSGDAEILSTCLSDAMRLVEYKDGEGVRLGVFERDFSP